MFKLLFLTSNRTKFQHARYLCSSYDMRVVEKPYYGVAYKEPRTQDRDKLFKDSIDEAKEKLLKQIKGKAVALSKNAPLILNKLFFLEDTSVKIHALSTDSMEFPGTEIKFWMKEITFASLDKLLKEHGNDRRVTVRSDILLYLPEDFREEGKNYKQFISSQEGFITEKEYNFKTNDLYPWLDNQSFNKWFVPNNCKVPISILPENEALKHDFRAGAFMDMLTFLEKKHVVKKKSFVCDKESQVAQLSLFDTPAFIVCGLPCAGKTTIGAYLSEKLGYYHVEASDFMYLSFYERHGVNSQFKISDFAEKALKKTPSIVVDQVIIHLNEAKDSPFIITGFRSTEEIESFLQQYKGLNVVHSVYIEADAVKRYQRNIKRSRQGDCVSAEDFQSRDKQQLRMGLKEIQTQLKSSTISNNLDRKNYYKCFLERHSKAHQTKQSISFNIPQDRPIELRDSILITLLNEAQFLTTTEIAHRINSSFFKGIRTSKNNVSRYFNQHFHPYYEIKKREDGKIVYRLSPTGKSRALLLLRRS